MIWMGEEYYRYPLWNTVEIFGQPDERHYYGFVEDVSPILNVEAIEAPDGGILKPDNRVFKHNPVRFRTSGIKVRYFLERLQGFDELEQGQIGAEQRRQRREQLRDFYEGAPVPVIDIYSSPIRDEFARMRQILVQSSWHHVIFSQGGEAAADHPVYLGEPYPHYPREFGPGELRALLPVPRWIEARLRDIFSLNHVPDAAIDERGEGGGAPAPTPPPDDDPMRPGPASVGLRAKRRTRRINLDPLEEVQVGIGEDDEDGEPQYLPQSP